MKSWLLLGYAVTAIAFGRQSAHTLPSVGIPVNVCMEPSHQEWVSETKAKPLVAAMFSQIGVNLTWHTGTSDCDRLPGQSVGTAFKIRWAEHAPCTSPAGTLASARPFGASGTSVTIYEAPLQRFLSKYANAPELVLAYVLAHELAHVMQRLDHHSDSGILKTNWSYREYYKMLSGTLTFTAQDADLIRAGLETKKLNIANREGE